MVGCFHHPFTENLKNQHPFASLRLSFYDVLDLHIERGNSKEEEPTIEASALHFVGFSLS